MRGVNKGDKLMRTRILAAALLAFAAPAAAQQDFSKVEVKVQRIAPGVAVLFGAGGNVGLSYGADGNIIVDDQYAPLSEKIERAVRSVDPDPVRFVINTHWHFDHTGGNENFGKAGAVILAHDNVRRRMSTDQFIAALDAKVPASPKAALPVVTFASAVTLHLNGDTLHVIHVADAHTDGDSLVHWQKADVLHMGDTFFFRDSFPFIDLSSGGSIHGMIAAAERGLAIAGPNTKIIPGHGPMATRADLARYRAMLFDVRTKVEAGIRARRTLAQIQATKPAAAYGMPSGFIGPDKFVESVFNSLAKAGARPHRHGRGR